jgi:hypothetical protein
MPLVYGVAAGWSWLRTGDVASRNVFERRAGLVDGGYREQPLRALWGRLEARSRCSVGVSAAPDTSELLTDRDP